MNLFFILFAFVHYLEFNAGVLGVSVSEVHNPGVHIIDDLLDEPGRVLSDVTECSPHWHERVLNVGPGISLLDAMNPSYTGKGVTLWVVDSGIEASHQEFRVGQVIPFLDKFPGTKMHSHGTAMASLAGGQTVGGAPDITLMDVRVIDSRGGGKTVHLANALTEIRKNITARTIDTPHIVGMALTTLVRAPMVDNAVNRLHEAGVAVVAAGGNYPYTKDCIKSPATASGSIVASAFNASGYHDPDIFQGGPCIDFLTPGYKVRCANVANRYRFSTGTSPATYILSGQFAQAMEASHGNLKQARGLMKKHSRTGLIQGLSSTTENRMGQNIPNLCAVCRSLSRYLCDLNKGCCEWKNKHCKPKMV